MTAFNPPLTVNVGTTPNDGTGDNLRHAFVVTNDNMANISSFLLTGPTFTSANIAILTAESIVANVATFHGGVTFNSDLSTTGNITVNGDIISSGTMYGNTHGDTVVTGQLMVTGGAGIVGNLQVGSITTDSINVSNNVVISGTLTVLGNVSTVTTSELSIIDPIIEIGRGNVDLTSDDGHDRGVKFYYFDGVQKTGFFGFEDADHKFTFTTDSNVSSTLGTAEFETVEANILSSGTSVFNAINANTLVVADSITGILATNVQPNVTSVGTLAELDVNNGDVTVINGNIHVNGGGTIYVGGNQVATSAQAFTGGVVPNPTTFQSFVTVNGNLSVDGSLSTSTFSAATLGGTLTTAAQPNITSVGTLGNLAISGSLTANSFGVNSISVATSVNASTISASTSLSGLLVTAAQPNITTVGTLSNLNVSNTVTTNKVTSSGMIKAVVPDSTYGFALSGVTKGIRMSTTPTQSLIEGVDNTLITTYQPISIIGSSVELYNSPTGNNLMVTDTGIWANGPFASLAATVTSLNAQNGLIQTTGNIQTSTNVVGTYLQGQLTSNAQPNVTSLGTLNSLVISNTLLVGGNAIFAGSIGASGSGTQAIGSTSNRFGTVYATAMNVTGAITAGTISGTFTGAAATIVNQANSATINATSSNSPNTIALRDGSGNFAANIISATATSAQYADLAEMYQSDGEYDSGTVLVFGGTREVTTTGHQADVSVAGVVSTAPAYLMNVDAPNAVAVALRGKVPVKVIGPVRKGDLLVTSYIPGYATSVGRDAKYGVAVFAKSLEEDLDEGQKIINAVII